MRHYSDGYTILYGAWNYQTDRSGRSNSAISLNRSGYGYIYSVIYGSTQGQLKSMAAWVYINSFSGCQYIFSADSTAHYYDWYFCSSQDVYFRTNNADYYLAYISSSSTWVHLGMVINSDSTYMTSYRNGYLYSTSYLASFTNYGGHLYLSNPNEPLNGAIDDLMFFATQLSASDMLSVMNYYN